MSGFELRSEPSQGRNDDAGAVDLKLICSDGQRTVAGGVQSWGHWTGERICPQQTAVCGISTQVEKPQGGGDDTALNNVGFDCCTVPHPANTCVPTSVWKTVLACHAGITDCKISFKSGTVTVTENFTSQGWTTTKYVRNGFDMSVEYGMGALTARAKESTEWGTETVTNKQISTLINENIYTEHEWSFSISCVGKAQELYIVCGPYEICTKEYRCVPDAVALPNLLSSKFKKLY